MKDFDSVLGVGIDLSKEGLFDQMFHIPTDALQQSNFIIFSKQEKIYSELTLPKDEIAQKLQLTLDKVLVKLSIKPFSISAVDNESAEMINAKI